MRAAYNVFAPYREVPKVTIFGSARTRPEDPLYSQTTELARANHGRLVACTLRGSVADVTVSAAAGGWLGWLPAVRLNARAGPAETYQ